MTSELKPSIIQMLEIGEACGLTYLDEAYDHYIFHYDMFFYMPDFAKQHEQFIQDLIDADLVWKVGTLVNPTAKAGVENHYQLKTMTIKEAKEQLNAKN